MQRLGKHLAYKAPEEWYRQQVHNLPLYAWHELWQRTFDVVGATAILILSAPLIGLGAALIKLTSRGPALYTQTRLGRYGEPFTIYKLRTMAHECERVSGPCWSQARDRRVTWAGWILRALHVDELPQLWNVLRGEMSLIGPRPERPELVPGLEKSLPHYRRRLLGRPGLTGLAQVLLPADTHVSNVSEKLPYDLYYVRYANPWMDLQIVLATILYLLRAPVSLRRSVLLLSADGSRRSSIHYVVYRLCLLSNCRGKVCA